MKKLIGLLFAFFVLFDISISAQQYISIGANTPFIIIKNNNTNIDNNYAGAEAMYSYFNKSENYGFNMFCGYSLPIKQNITSLTLNDNNINISDFDYARLLSFGLGISFRRNINNLYFFESFGPSFCNSAFKKTDYINNNDLLFSNFGFGGYINFQFIYKISKYFGIDASCTVNVLKSFGDLYINYEDSTLKNNNTQQIDAFQLIITPSIFICLIL